jgi:hypothetical protein
MAVETVALTAENWAVSKVARMVVLMADHSVVLKVAKLAL